MSTLKVSEARYTRALNPIIKVGNAMRSVMWGTGTQTGVDTRGGQAGWTGWTRVDTRGGQKCPPWEGTYSGVDKKCPPREGTYSHWIACNSRGGHSGWTSGMDRVDKGGHKSRTKCPTFVHPRRGAHISERCKCPTFVHPRRGAHILRGTHILGGGVCVCNVFVGCCFCPTPWRHEAKS